MQRQIFFIDACGFKAFFVDELSECFYLDPSALLLEVKSAEITVQNHDTQNP